MNGIGIGVTDEELVDTVLAVAEGTLSKSGIAESFGGKRTPDSGSSGRRFKIRPTRQSAPASLAPGISIKRQYLLTSYNIQ